MEEKKVQVIGDIGVSAELGLNDVNEPGATELTEYERMFLDGARRLIRGRIELLLEEDPGAAVEKES